MSLINDALKKAQKMRHDASLPPAPDSAPRVEAPLPDPKPVPSLGHPTQRSGFSGLSVGLIALGSAALVSLSIFATVFLLRSPAGKPILVQEPVAPTASTPADLHPTVLVQEASPGALVETPSTALVKREPAAISTPSAEPVPAPVQSQRPMASATQVPSSAKEFSSPQITLPQMPPTVTSHEVASQPAMPPTPQTSVSPKDKTSTGPGAVPTFVFGENQRPTGNPIIQHYVDSVKIGGIRRMNGGPRVVLNGQVYRLNEVVDRTLNLRLMEVTADQLIFMDAQGIRYTRSL